MMDQAILSARARLYENATSSREYITYVQRHGIDPWAVMPFAGATALLPIFDLGGGRFDFEPHLPTFDDDGPIAGFICEAIDEDGEGTFDLVAWPAERPGTVLSLLGRAGFLNLWAVFNAASYTMGKAMPVHRTPLDWLKSGCRGTAIVAPSVAAREMLDLPGPLLAEDRRHARELARIAESLVPRDLVVVAETDRAAV